MSVTPKRGAYELAETLTEKLKEQGFDYYVESTGATVHLTYDSERDAYVADLPHGGYVFVRACDVSFDVY